MMVTMAMMTFMEMMTFTEIELQRVSRHQKRTNFFTYHFCLEILEE